MKECTRCGEKGIVKLDYVKKWYCKDCFNRIIEKRFKAYIRQHGLFDPKDRVLVSMSPNASGAACAHLMSKIKEKMPDLKVKGLYINLHFRPYSDKAEKMFKKNDYGIPIIYRDLNVDSCESCRQRRANALFSTFRKDKYKTIITSRDANGKTLCYLSSFFKKKIPPTTRVMEPMSRISRKESKIYCDFNGLQFLGDCPRRNDFEKSVKKLVERVEDRIPGAMLAFVKSVDEILY